MRSSEQGLAYIKWLQSSEGQGLGELRGNGKLPHPVRQGQERPLQGQHLTCTLGHRPPPSLEMGRGSPGGVRQVHQGLPAAAGPISSLTLTPGLAAFLGPIPSYPVLPLEIVTRSCSHFLTPHLFLILCNLAPAPGTAETLLSLPAASEPVIPGLVTASLSHGWGRLLLANVCSLGQLPPLFLFEPDLPFTHGHSARPRMPSTRCGVSAAFLPSALSLLVLTPPPPGPGAALSPAQLYSLIAGGEGRSWRVVRTGEIDLTSLRLTHVKRR